jgi:hypothetical protein
LQQFEQTNTAATSHGFRIISNDAAVIAPTVSAWTPSSIAILTARPTAGGSCVVRPRESLLLDLFGTMILLMV